MFENRKSFQNKDFNVDTVLNDIAVVKDFENQLDGYLDQIQKDIVSVLDLNYSKLQELGQKIHFGLSISEKIEEELQVVDKMTKNSLMVGDFDPESPEGKLIKIREQKQILLNEHYLKLDLDYLKSNKIPKAIDIVDYTNLELLEYFLLIANRAKSFIEASSEERQIVFVKQYEPIRVLIDTECVYLVDLIKQFKIQNALKESFPDCLQIVFKSLVLSGKWEDAMPNILNKLITEPISDLQKTLLASVSHANFEMKYGIIENYLKGLPLLVCKLIHPFASSKEMGTLILDFIFQNVVKHVTDQKLMANNNSDYSKDYIKSLGFIQFFKSHFIDPFRLEREFKNHPGFIIFKRKFNPIPYANVQKAEISKVLTAPFDSKKLIKAENAKYHFEYFLKLHESLDKIQTIQIMPQTAEVSSHLLFLIFDNLLENSKLYNELPVSVIESVFYDFLSILSFLKQVTAVSMPVEVTDTYKMLIKRRFSTVESLFNKLAKYALQHHIESKMTNLQQIRNIPSIVRMGSKEINAIPSPYVQECGDKFEIILKHFNEIRVKVVDIYANCNVFHEQGIHIELGNLVITIATEVLGTIKKTEESLKRFKKVATTNKISDEDKMRAQIYVDCCCLFAKVLEINVDLWPIE